MPKKMGRPRIARSKARTNFVGTRLLADEDQEIQDAIRKSGRTQSDWIREALLNAARKKKSSG
jgi:Mobilization protein NikA